MLVECDKDKKNTCYIYHVKKDRGPVRDALATNEGVLPI